ncbi:MAG: GGDEF domain-containing protein [Candidatus Wenzhouxiangella sp. M2_3B_020]
MADRQNWPITSAWLQRMRADYRLAIVTLFMVCTIVAILPFALYRFYIGDLIIGLVDTFIIVAMAASMIYAWRSGNSNLAGMLASGMASFMAVFLTLVLDLEYLWAFSALVANFLLAPRTFALTAGIVVMVVIGATPGAFESSMVRFTFFSVGAMVGVFSLVFASRVDSQRHQLERQAYVDPLTGVGNRRAMEVDLAALSRGAGGESCGIVLLDIDHFQRVNDIHGHDAGDRVLEDLAALLKRTLRRGDGVYRYGGEEFFVVLPGIEADDMKVVMDKQIEAARSALRGPGGPITVSLGGTVMRPEGSWSDAVSRADRALYEAKADRGDWHLSLD